MNTKLSISDHMLKQSKRWSHQADRRDKIWTAISNEDSGQPKGDRMRRAMGLQDECRARMGITLGILIIGVEL